MSDQAANAIRAARNRSRWGLWATHRFLAKRNVHIYLYALALNLEK
jgi:hypothetical protein